MKKVVVDVEALGGKITLYELTQEYRVECNEDDTFDTPTNGLLNAGLTLEQIHKLGQHTVVSLYEEVIDLTYPNARVELENMIKDGTFKLPTDKEKEESKKNF